MKKNRAFIILAIGFTVLVNSSEKAFAQEGISGKGIPAGYMIIEGDILVPVDFYENRVQAAWRQNSFWPNGIVPFQFNDNVTQANRNAMLAAMAEWERVANVDFIPRTTEDAWVEIMDSDVNSSHVGREGRRQVINIFNWDNRWIMCHELAHCLGLWHEQSSPKRDGFVQINWKNIQGDTTNSNFQKHDDAGQYGPYDFDSVMHYDDCAFSIDCPPNSSCNCVKRSITVLPPNEDWQNRIGQRTHLSRLDTLTMSFLYPQSHWRFVDAENAGLVPRGTFLNPFGTFTPSVVNSIFIPTGAVVWIQPGRYSSIGVYEKAITIEAPLGGVVLGQ